MAAQGGLAMTMARRDLSTMPADTAAVGGRVLGEGDPYRVLGDRLADLITDDQFAELYDARGRHAISPSVLALVTLFQFVEDVPDREAARLVAVRLDWKYALRLPLDASSFDFTCLCYFRQRLLAHDRDRLVFDTLLGRLRDLGFVRARGKQRTDSLGVLGAVRALSELETVTETLRLAVRALERAAPAWAARALAPEFRERCARQRPDYRLSAAERQAALVAAGEDAAWLLGQVARAPAAVRDLEEAGLLRAVWAQRYERAADGEVLRRAEPAPCPERIVTPHDPEARAGEKRGRRWHGDKVHITETAEPVSPEAPNFIVDVTTASAASADIEALPEIRQRLIARDLAPAEHFVDSGYVSGKQLRDSRAAGIELVGPPLADTSPAELKLADFTIDRAARRATCPAGHPSAKWSARADRDGSRAVNIQFAAAVCAACPLRPRCTTSQTGRSLHLSEHFELLQARRAEARTDAFRQRMHARPGVEATLSELVRAHGLRRHRYRGDRKRHFEHLLKAAACNLKRLLRALAARTAPAPAAAPA
ncbi:MAG TPA: IS1182 family transposase [Gaiellaceae bacterium]